MRAIIKSERGNMFTELTTENDVKIKVNLSQVCWIDGAQIVMGNGMTVNLSSESMYELEQLTAPKNRQTKSNHADPELEALFIQLHRLTKGKGKPTFSLQREKKLKDLLGKHRLTKEDLIRAATNIGNDEFLQGDNDNKKRYGDVDYLLRPDKAAKWADEQEKKKKGMF